MDFEKQKPSTQEYRDNWARVFGAKVWSDGEHWMNSQELIDAQTGTYPNGCPIIEAE